MSERLCMDLDEVRKLLRDYKHRADRAAEVLETTRAISDQRAQEIERLRLRVHELEAAVEVLRPAEPVTVDGLIDEAFRVHDESLRALGDGWDGNGAPA